MTDSIREAMLDTKAMDYYLEARSAQEIIDDIKTLLGDSDGAPETEDAQISKLIDACRGVPYLATCIVETINKAGMKLVAK